MSPSPLEGREKVGRGREGRRREEREWVREVKGGEEREGGRGIEGKRKGGERVGEGRRE